MAGDEQNFGGTWTAKKLEILKKYLGFYSTALKNQDFILHYVDPFSGTGSIDSSQGLLELDPVEGSVKIALSTKLPFHKYHFNEPNKKKRAKLEEITSQYPEFNISIKGLDANEMVTEVCRELGHPNRAVFFIDPFGCQLDWASLTKIANIPGNDVWLWFPVSGVNRQLPIEHSKMQDGWRKRLDSLFGTNAWEHAIYQIDNEEITKPEIDLFGEPIKNAVTRDCGTQALDAFIKNRLEEIFSYVHPTPVKFFNTNNSNLFNLYFAMSNKSERAIHLAENALNNIIKRHG